MKRLRFSPAQVEMDSDDSAGSVERNDSAGSLQELAGNVLSLEARLAHTPQKPVVTKRFENNIPVVTADLTPRKKREARTPTQSSSRSPSPIAPTAKPKKKAVLEVAVTVDSGKVVTLPVYQGDTAIDVANRLLLGSSKLALKSLAEDIERSVSQYMTVISRELAAYHRLSKETTEARSRALLDRAKPPDLQTAKRARKKDRQVLGAVNVDAGNGAPWTITVREGDRAIDLAMEFCTKHGLSHSQLEDISGPIQELISSSELRQPIFKVMIEVAQGKNAPLEVRYGDDLHVLAARFVEQHRLSKHLIKPIHDLLVKTESVHEAKRLIRVSEVVHYD